MKSGLIHASRMVSITFALILCSCSLTEKSNFLNMMAQVSNMKNEIKADMETLNEQPVSSDAELQEKIDKSIVELVRKNQNRYKFVVLLNKNIEKNNVICINTVKAISGGIVSIKGFVNYPSTNYLVEINRDIFLKSRINKTNMPKKAYRIMVSSLEPIQTEDKINSIPGYKFMDRSTDTPFLVVDYDFKNAFGIINSKSIQFKSTDMSLALPDLTQEEVGTKFIRCFKSDNITIDIDFTLIARDSLDDCVITEQKADVKLTSPTGTHIYSLNNKNGG